MNLRSVTMIPAALLLIGGGAYYAYSIGGQAQLPINKSNPKTFVPAGIQLEVVIDGGFAYIPSGNTLNIAYLDSWKYANPISRGGKRPAVETFSCNVEQMGTELQVGGDIIEPSSGKTTYDLNETVVTFPALASSTATLSATRGARPGSPFKPANTSNAAEWEDLRFVPSLLAEHGAKLNSKWRELVNGYMVLKGGTLKGVRPGRFADYMFDFRNGSEPKFKQALTDRTVYTVNIPGDRVEILLASLDGTTKVVVKPSGSSKTVSLLLLGKHDPNKAKPPKNDEPLMEHCTFYQLFDPVPSPTLWLRPVTVAPPNTGTSSQPKPLTPGFFCPGDWF